MSSSGSIDIRIINFIVRQLDGYVRKKDRRDKINSDKMWLKKFGNENYIIHELAEGLKIKLYRDSILSRYIYKNFETTEINFLNEFLDTGDYFLDIGSNIGLFSLYASKKVGSTGKVIAFEPAGQTYSRLLENIQLNGINNIQPFRLGLSDKDEILELNISSDGHEAWNTFVPTNDRKYSLKEKVEVKTLDHVIQENDLDSDKIWLVKLDVEGFEINVLRGSDKLLSSPKAPVFLVEFTDENAVGAGNCCHELYKLLLKYNYTWFTYDTATKKLKKEAMRVSYPYNNLIAVKDPANNNRISQFITESV